MADTVGEGSLRAAERAGLDRALAYRRVWWSRHDAAKRRWIVEMQPLVAAHGAAMVRAVTRDFDIAWPDFLLRVDASAYSSWAGAYTTVYPARITVATLDTSCAGEFRVGDALS